MSFPRKELLNGLDLFSGIGGLTLALREWVKPIAYCEIEPYCQSVLLQRMQEGNLPHAPIWDDIRKLSRNVLFDAGIISYPIDIIYGGFPCQDISIAGTKKGLEGERSSLFFEISRLINEIQPSFIFLENVPNIRTKGAERVCKELAERGYDSRWCCISASDLGAPHKRERWFLLAHSNSKHNGPFTAQIQNCDGETILRRQEGKECAVESKGMDSSSIVAYSLNTRRDNAEFKMEPAKFEQRITKGWWEVEPSVGRVADGIPHRVDRIKALGNSVVPTQVTKAFSVLVGMELISR